MRIIVDVLWMGKIIIKYGAFLEHDSDLSGQGGGKRRGVELKSKQNTHLLSIPLQRTRCILWVAKSTPFSEGLFWNRFKPGGSKWTFLQLCSAQPKQGKSVVFWGFWDKLDLSAFQWVCDVFKYKWWDNKVASAGISIFRRIKPPPLITRPLIWTLWWFFLLVTEVSGDPHSAVTFWIKPSENAPIAPNMKISSQETWGHRCNFVPFWPKKFCHWVSRPVFITNYFFYH